MKRFWVISHRADRRALPLADRHYNRQKPGSPQFVPPGRCLVFLTPGADALWVSSWPFPEFVKHDWPGAWVCNCFRNESGRLSSTLIRQAVAATRHAWGEPPDLGMVSFIDTSKTRPKRHPGRCYLEAGFRRPACPECGGPGVTAGGEPCPRCGGDGLAYTRGGLVVVQLPPSAMPDPDPARGIQLSLFA
jgi:hypothetical protein